MDESIKIYGYKLPFKEIDNSILKLLMGRVVRGYCEVEDADGVLAGITIEFDQDVCFSLDVKNAHIVIRSLANK